VGVGRGVEVNVGRGVGVNVGGGVEVGEGAEVAVASGVAVCSVIVVDAGATVGEEGKPQASVAIASANVMIMKTHLSDLD
jgi:hypothetical protein